MNIDFELYRIFYTVANNGNITKASEELNITQPAISKAIKKLEEQMGGQLFVRTKRGVVLTVEGKEFYKYIKQAIEYITNGENKFTELINLDSGCIRIGISTTLTKEFLLPFLKKFHKQYPNIDIQIYTYLTADLIPKIRNGLIDLVILNMTNINYGEDIEIIPCKKVHDCFIVNESHKLANKKVSLKDLNKYPLVLQAKNSNTRIILDEFTKTHNVTLKPNIELASYSLVVEFAKIGLGIGYATKEYLTEELKNNEIKILDLEESIPGRYIGIATSNNHIPNFCTKKLIEIITQK